MEWLVKLFAALLADRRVRSAAKALLLAVGAVLAAQLGLAALLPGV